MKFFPGKCCWRSVSLVSAVMEKPRISLNINSKGLSNAGHKMLVSVCARVTVWPESPFLGQRSVHLQYEYTKRKSFSLEEAQCQSFDFKKSISADEMSVRAWESPFDPNLHFLGRRVCTSVNLLKENNLHSRKHNVKKYFSRRDVSERPRVTIWPEPPSLTLQLLQASPSRAAKVLSKTVLPQTYFCNKF